MPKGWLVCVCVYMHEHTICLRLFVYKLLMKMYLTVVANEVLETLQLTAKSAAEIAAEFSVSFCFGTCEIWRCVLGWNERCFWNTFSGITIRSNIQGLQTALMTRFSWLSCHELIGFVHPALEAKLLTAEAAKYYEPTYLKINQVNNAIKIESSFESDWRDCCALLLWLIFLYLALPLSLKWYHSSYFFGYIFCL